TTFAPKAPPGSCQVIRPEGAGTTNFISLSGECNGEIPQYVAVFNGQTSYVSLPTSIVPIGAMTRTLTAWFYTTSNINQNILGYGANSACNSGFDININLTCYGGGTNIGVAMDPGCGLACSSPPGASLNSWYFVAVTYNGIAAVTYLSSTKGGLTSGGVDTYTANTNVDAGFNIGHGAGYHVLDPYFSGLISNVQLYNTALSSNDI
ncbi:hypothetical protein B2A_04970, partial [mine drainage metagenome]